MVRKRQGLFAKLAWWALAGLIGFVFATVTINRSETPGERLPPTVPILENPETLESVPPPGHPGGFIESEAIFRGYLGIHGNRLAVYHGKPPDGELKYVTEYEVREDLREQLEAGVPFADAQELLRLLENYTS